MSWSPPRSSWTHCAARHRASNLARSARKTSRSRAREGALAAAAAVSVPASCDVVVVGGGASGLAAAIAAAEAGAGVVVLERSLECGRTILATGNGRCNFSNARLSWDRYNNPAFVEAVCGEHFGADVLDFFEDCGLAWVEEGGRLYPLSRKASSVREVLLARARRAGVTLAPAREVASLECSEGGYLITLAFDSQIDPNWRVMTHRVIYAAGGCEKLTGSLGLSCAPDVPVLCSLSCAPQDQISLAALDGRRAHVVARLLRDGSTVAVETGEVLFRPYGLSGIVIFDLSRLARRGDVISLDLLCGLDADRARSLEAAAGSCAGMIDPAIAEALGNRPFEMACDLHFIVSGPAEPERAQVTRGGLLTEQFDPSTLEARALPGFFACGEALNVDGACGGFNLAWAWKSGIVAGRAAAAATGRCI